MKIETCKNCIHILEYKKEYFCTCIEYQKFYGYNDKAEFYITPNIKNIDKNCIFMEVKE